MERLCGADDVVDHRQQTGESGEQDGAQPEDTAEMTPPVAACGNTSRWIAALGFGIGTELIERFRQFLRFPMQGRKSPDFRSLAIVLPPLCLGDDGLLDRLADSPHVVRMMRLRPNRRRQIRYPTRRTGRRCSSPFLSNRRKFQPEFWPGHEGMDVWNAERSRKFWPCFLNHSSEPKRKYAKIPSAR